MRTRGWPRRGLADQMIAAVVFLAIGVACCGALVVYDRRQPPDILSERLRAKVILTLKTGEAFRGVLWTQDARAVVLRNADALAMGERGTDIGVDGELVVLREDVAYLQVL